MLGGHLIGLTPGDSGERNMILLLTGRVLCAGCAWAADAKILAGCDAQGCSRLPAAKSSFSVVQRFECIPLATVALKGHASS